MTTNRNSWSEKEEQVLINILEKNKDYVLEYSFNLAAIKLNRSLSAIRQHYYYHKNYEIEWHLLMFLNWTYLPKL